MPACKPPTPPLVFRHQGPAVVVWWTCELELRRDAVDGVEVTGPHVRGGRPALQVALTPPPGRRGHRLLWVAADQVYALARGGGKVLWESRWDLPCDFAKWCAGVARARGLGLTDEALLRGPGNPSGENQHTEDKVNVDIINIDHISYQRPTGTSREQAIRKLGTEAAPPGLLFRQRGPAVLLTWTADGEVARRDVFGVEVHGPYGRPSVRVSYGVLPPSGWPPRSGSLWLLAGRDHGAVEVGGNLVWESRRHLPGDDAAWQAGLAQARALGTAEELRWCKPIGLGAEGAG